MARQDRQLHNFISLLSTQKSRKSAAEAASGYLKARFKLIDCLIVMDETATSAPRSYGDKHHYLPSLILPAPGRGLIVPDSMTQQGWFYHELHTHKRIGWLLMQAKRPARRHLKAAVIEPFAQVLAISLSGAAAQADLREVSKQFDEQLQTSTRQLTRTNNKLVALDETKDEFITMASHQLRTPLTSIKGYLSMVLEGDAGPLNTQQSKLLNQAFISSQRMVYLIADLLNVSRLRTGRFVIEAKPTYLPDVVSGELEQLIETAEARGLKLQFDRPKQFPRLELDETKIRQVIMNFIDNAIYYTPAGGEIRIELQAYPRSVELRVVDTGLGVPRADQHKLFSKFFRADNARRARPDGTGLGLFMAKKVIIAQGGALIFRSVEGKGSTFGFTFPLPNKTQPK